MSNIFIHYNVITGCLTHNEFSLADEIPYRFTSINGIQFWNISKKTLEKGNMLLKSSVSFLIYDCNCYPLHKGTGANELYTSFHLKFKIVLFNVTVIWPNKLYIIWCKRFRHTQ